MECPKNFGVGHGEILFAGVEPQHEQVDRHEDNRDRHGYYRVSANRSDD